MHLASSRVYLQQPQHALSIVYLCDWEMQVLLERLHDSFCLFIAQQPIVDKDAVQPVPKHLMHQRCRNSAVHSARESADHMIVWPHLNKPLSSKLHKHDACLRSSKGLLGEGREAILLQ